MYNNMYNLIQTISGFAELPGLRNWLISEANSEKLKQILNVSVYVA